MNRLNLLLLFIISFIFTLIFHSKSTLAFQENKFGFKKEMISLSYCKESVWRAKSIKDLKKNDEIVVVNDFNQESYHNHYTNLPINEIFYVKNLFTNGSDHYVHVCLKLKEYMGIGLLPLFPEAIFLTGYLGLKYFLSSNYKERPSRFRMKYEAILKYQDVKKINTRNKKNNSSNLLSKDKPTIN